MMNNMKNPLFITTLIIVTVSTAKKGLCFRLNLKNFYKETQYPPPMFKYTRIPKSRLTSLLLYSYMRVT